MSKQTAGSSVDRSPPVPASFGEDSWDTGGAGTNGTSSHPASTRPLARRDQRVRHYLTQLPPGSLAVNIGCGLVRRFETDCPDRYLATDLRPLANVDFAADAARLPLPDRSVDALIALEMLEHVPEPRRVLEEIARVLKPGGRVIISVPSTVPRHDDHDYWRFTAQGLDQLCADLFDNGKVEVFGGTFEALGCLAKYYSGLLLHRAANISSDRFLRFFQIGGYWLDRHNSWSTSTTALHTLAFDLLYTATAPADGKGAGRS